MQIYTAKDNYSSNHYSGNDHYSVQIIRKTTVLEEVELGLFTGFEDTTAKEKKSRFFRYSGRLLYYKPERARLRTF